jgi:hypothetical protein
MGRVAPKAATMHRGIKQIGERRLDGSRIRHSAWKPIGGKLALGSDSGNAQIWDVKRNQVGLLKAHGAKVEHLVWSPNGAFLATSASDCMIRLWEESASVPFLTLQAQAEQVVSIAWTPDGKQIRGALLLKPDRARFLIRTWDARTGQQQGDALEMDLNANHLAWSSDRRVIAVVSKERKGCVVDVVEACLLAELPWSNQQVYGIALDQSRRKLTTSFAEHGKGILESWDLDRHQLLGSRPLSWPAYSLDLSHDDCLLAIRSANGDLELRSNSSWELLACVPEPSVDASPADLVFHPNVAWLASYADGETEVRIWSIDGEALKRSHKMRKILFLSADPVATHSQRLRLDQEQRDIEERLQLASLREEFEMHSQLAVRPADFSGVLLRYKPNIVHFSGHGDKEGQIYIEGSNGELNPMSTRALTNLFRELASHIECVVLNACYAEQQALAIGKHIHYVIGMRDEIYDDAAIAFSVGFYQALGEGCDVEQAFRLGRNLIDSLTLPDYLVPVLVKDGVLLIDPS